MSLMSYRIKSATAVVVCLAMIGAVPSHSRGSDPPTQQQAERRGRVSGIVTNAATGEPIAGAYVAIDHSGDAGGSNLEGFRQQGIYVTSETDAAGRFVLESVAFRDDHPFMVTHRGFVRHDQTIALQRDNPETHIRVALKPGSAISVTAVDADDTPLKGMTYMRLEAKGGRVFRPLREDWPITSSRMETTADGTFSFGELDTGAYSIDVIRPSAAGLIYHAGIAEVEVEAAQTTKKVRLKPAEHQTRLTIEIAEDPGPDSEWPMTLAIARKPGLCLWAGTKFYHPEDQRLGRVLFNSLVWVPILTSTPYSLENFPAGEYSVFAWTLGKYGGFQSAGVYLRGMRVRFRPGQEAVVEIPWSEPDGPSHMRSSTLLALDSPARLAAPQYTAKQLCDLLTEATASKARFMADVSIQDEKLVLRPGQRPIWDVLELVYLEKGWRVDEEPGMLVLRPK